MSKTQVFIEKARAVHGDRYDYGRTVYVHSKRKVIIHCKEHGDFEQTPNDHLSGKGCAKCAGMHSYSTIEWVDKAIGVHGKRYDYSGSTYIGSKNKISILCRIHGMFYQTSGDHLSGSNCPKCADRHRHTTEEWVKKAQDVHGSRYTYEKSKYARNHSKIIITCAQHGDFKQNTSDHLSGSGCPRCPRRYNDPSFVYLLENSKAQVKIGYSIEPDSRLRKFNARQPFEATLISMWELPDTPTARIVETDIHSELSSLNAGLTGFDGATEWFDTTPEYAIPIIEKIISQHKSG